MEQGTLLYLFKLPTTISPCPDPVKERSLAQWLRFIDQYNYSRIGKRP